MKLPSECQSLMDVRSGIDRLDKQIITALGERLKYVKAASAFKKDEKSIPAPERVAAMLPLRRAWAHEAGLDADFVEKIFRELIAWFINEQVLYYRATARSRPDQEQEHSIDHRAMLLEMLRTGIDRAKSSGRFVLVSLTRPINALDPIKAFDAARKCSQKSFLWTHLDADFSVVGVDAARVITATNGERFTQVGLAWRDLLEGAVIDNPQGGSGSGPLLGGGFSFDPAQTKAPLWSDFDDASMVLPKLQLTRSANASYLTLNFVVEPSMEPALEADRLDQQWLELLGKYAETSPLPPTDGERHSWDVLHASQWKTLVSDAAATIRAGNLDKVVLAREVRVTNTQRFAVAPALDRLRNIYPGAYLFAVARADRCFFGATPERLVRLVGNKVDVTALAGTCQRGSTEADDDRLGDRLLNSTKDRHEHALVVETLRSTLGAFCNKLSVPLQPTLLKLKNVQHLFTPISGELAVDLNLLDLVATLHPTPAVGGLPRTSALDYLRSHEQLDRGWYAGPVGWIDAHGNGEFAVALRSALVSGNEASLFAGCGIVGDSEPEHEFLETCLKLRTMMFALGHEERAR